MVVSDLQLYLSADGSHTLFHPGVKQHYHSTFGAIQESQHVFIEAGLKRAFASHRQSAIHILEIGFGTGLNALLTLIEAEKARVRVSYTTIEPFPVARETWSMLNYPQKLDAFNATAPFMKIHQAEWDHPDQISSHFRLVKIHDTVASALNKRAGPCFVPDHPFQLVYFDAFGPDAQPELWTPEIFRQIYNRMAKDGALVTYSVKGDVVRALKSAGFAVEKLPGPPGKRHILRATK